MPYPNEHAGRLKDPRQFVRFRRMNNQGGQGVDFIVGFKREGGSEVQAIRFDASKFTVEQAKAWLKEHNYKTIAFEKASGSDNAEYAIADNSKINDWIEVAKTGKFPQGDLDQNLFDKLVKNFKPDEHEPPHTLGHIRESHNDKPAFGWIAGLKRVGNTLLAKSKQVSKTLDNFVREGAFKKRSIGIRINTNGEPYLHHLAWLGSTVPAVKGLSNIYDDDPVFSYSELDSDKQKEFDYPFNQGVKKMEYTEKEIQEIKDRAKADGEAQGKADAEKNFNETVKPDLEKKAEAKGKADAEKEYKDNEEKNNKIRAYKGDVDALIKEFSEEGKTKDGKKVAPKLVPAQVAPLRELLYSLGENKAVEYAEKDKDGKEKTVKTDALKLVRDILSNFAEAPKGSLKDTEEGAKGEEAQYEEEKAEAEKIVKEYKDNGETITFGQALIKAREKLGRNKDGDGDGE